MTVLSRHSTVAAIALTAALALSACGASSDPTKAAPASSGSAGTAGAVTSVVVGAADFSESQVLAEIYAGALAAKGIKATTRPNIG
ncbi:MAG: glycine/betaine ABC transporter substrate-binding protein, partial [Dermatophilaceae bacterium]|nr:glycine/betaine ABC transporter substrate-binding protein [Dermatophilaceae bacterium]